MSITRIFLLFVLPLALFLLVASSSTHGQIAKETPLMTKHLPDMPGKEGLVETVVLSPGEVVPRGGLGSGGDLSRLGRCSTIMAM